jgi:hypothetical protein
MRDTFVWAARNFYGFVIGALRVMWETTLRFCDDYAIVSSSRVCDTEGRTEGRKEELRSTV